MSSYISGIGCISPQNTISNDVFLTEPVNQNALFLQCIQPESYRDYINPLLSRRLSRIIKMGITSALISIKEAGIDNPGAIITGTGLGCVEDTEKFLMTMLDNNETLMNPTNFMQSTYNTISSQIAIILKCFNYNSTYVHRGFSFESALTDALDLIRTGEANSALVGGIDEFTENHFRVTSLLGDWRCKTENNLDLIRNPGLGTIPGEGSVFVTLTKDKVASTYACLQGTKTLYKPKSKSLIYGAITKLLEENQLRLEDIDLIVAGMNGNAKGDVYYLDVINNLFANTPVAVFKNLCGEYHTASAFGMWLSANIIKRQFVPEVCLFNAHKPSKIKHVLLYNHFAGQQHSLMLLSKI
ncbi:MAG: beta-ketoacyl synthase N-terminal-like domain-containing protein [Bacteroidota bacterium]